MTSSKQVPILLWSSANVLWTMKLHSTYHQHGCEFSFLGELIFQLERGALTLTSTLPFATPDWLTSIQCYIVSDPLSGHMILDDVIDWLLWLLSQGHCRAVGECWVVVGEVARGQRWGFGWAAQLFDPLGAKKNEITVSRLLFFNLHHWVQWKV